MSITVNLEFVWNIVQKLGEEQRARIERHAELAQHGQGVGILETKLLYEENDGIWLNLQGKDRKQYGKSKEMKVGIAEANGWYDPEGGTSPQNVGNLLELYGIDVEKHFKGCSELSSGMMRPGQKRRTTGRGCRKSKELRQLFTDPRMETGIPIPSRSHAESRPAATLRLDSFVEA